MYIPILSSCDNYHALLFLLIVGKPSVVNNYKNVDVGNNSAQVIDKRYEQFYIDNYFEYEQGQASPILRGRLKSSLPFWISINTNPQILDITEHGYRLPFIETPLSAEFRNNNSAYSHADFVSKAILELVDNSIVRECSSSPLVVNPLSVSEQANGKLRLILDLRYINHSLWKDKVKFEDWSHALSYLQNGDYMFSWDLKSGYHHIEIFPNHTQFLGFSWTDGGKVRYYTFQCLPFGLATAPYIFTKCLRPLVKHWRSMGFFVVMYIDDGWCRAATDTECTRVASIVKGDLISSGFVPNVDKSHWTPTQQLDWLGMRWDAYNGKIHIVHRRIQDIHLCLESLRRSLPWTTPRKVAALTGKIISTIPVVGNIAQLKTRYMYHEILERIKWDKVFRIDDGSRLVEELFFWKEI